MKFSPPGGFNNGEEFYQYLKDAFDVLYTEGEIWRLKCCPLVCTAVFLGRP